MNPYRMLNGYKELPIELLNLKPGDMKDLVFEYLFWDGRYENYLKNDKNIIITSTNLNTLNLLQIMCVLSGIRAYLKKESHSQKRPNYCYDLVLYKNQTIVTPEHYTYSTRIYNGIVWCLSNDNHTLIIRKNGRTMIIGNCGNDPSDTNGCVLLGQNKAKGKVLNSRVTFKKVYSILKEAHDKGEEIWLTIK